MLRDVNKVGFMDRHIIAANNKIVLEVGEDRIFNLAKLTPTERVEIMQKYGNHPYAIHNYKLDEKCRLKITQCIVIYPDSICDISYNDYDYDTQDDVIATAVDYDENGEYKSIETFETEFYDFC